MTVIESLRGVNAYPIPERTIERTVLLRGLDASATITADVLRSHAYRLAEADLQMWLANAPDVSQGGQSYGFTDEQRQQLRNSARAIYREEGEDDASAKTTYGYKGDRL